MKELQITLSQDDKYRCESRKCDGFGKKLLRVEVSGGIAEGKAYQFGPTCPTTENLDHEIAVAVKRVIDDTGFDTSQHLQVRVTNVPDAHAWSFDWYKPPKAAVANA